MDLSDTDIIVLAIGGVVVILAIAMTMGIIYCGYCKDICRCCKSGGGQQSAAPGRRAQAVAHGLVAGYNLKTRTPTSLVPLTSDDTLDQQYASMQAGDDQQDASMQAGDEQQQRQGFFLPADIDSRPPAPPIETLESDDEEDNALDMGLVFVPGQALSDLAGGDYNYPETENIDDEGASAPPLQPRANTNWGVVRQRLVKPPPRQLVLEEVEVTGRNADHDEDHYATVGGCFRYLAPRRISTLEEIGHGEFGTVCRGTWSSEEHGVMSVALKSARRALGSPFPERMKQRSSFFGPRKLIDEGRIMSTLEHPNVIRLFGVVMFDSTITLVLELLAGGSLLNHLSKLCPDPGKPVESSLAGRLLSLAQDVVSGLKYLAEKNFIHRDLAARNVLIDANSVAKISDFGMSRLLCDDEYYTFHGCKLPYRWCAPEVINFRKFSLASDVWSFGVMLHEIWSFGRKPYFTMGSDTVTEKVCKGYRMHPPPGCSRKLYTIMAECWYPCRYSRPTAAKLRDELATNAVALLQLDSAARRKLSGVPEEAYQLGADPEHSKQLYRDITAKYSQIEGLD